MFGDDLRLQLTLIDRGQRVNFPWTLELSDSTKQSGRFIDHIPRPVYSGPQDQSGSEAEELLFSPHWILF